MEGNDWSNWWFSCGKKNDYKSKETAQRSAHRMNETGQARNLLEPYHCKFCKGWHIGRKKTWYRKLRKWMYRLWEMI